MTQLIEKTAQTIEEGFQNLKDAAITDYNKFIQDNEQMQKEYAENIILEQGGSKYYKIVVGKPNAGRSVFGFIVKESDEKFKKGDLLKPASWKSPAKNKARGNVLTGKYPINWTGPLYLL